MDDEPAHDYDAAYRYACRVRLLRQHGLLGRDAPTPEEFAAAEAAYVLKQPRRQPMSIKREATLTARLQRLESKVSRLERLERRIDRLQEQVEALAR